jgi:hypothetical protein
LQQQARTAPGLPLSDRTEKVVLRDAQSDRESAIRHVESAFCAGAVGGRQLALISRSGSGDRHF